MKKNLIMLMMISGLLLTASAMAKSKTYDLTLSTAMEANGVQLKAGNYDVAVEDGSLLFYQKGKEVANVPRVRVDQLAKKNQNTTTTMNTAQLPIRLTNIRFGGTTMELVLEGATELTP